MTLLDEEQRTWIRRADALSKLPQIEGFQFLTEEMELKRRRMEKELITRVLAEGMDAETIKLNAERYHGFVAGMRYAVLVVPAGAARRLELREQPPEDDNEEVEDRWVL